VNFFERQERARRNSRLLVVLFVLGVAGTIAVIDLVALAIWYLLVVVSTSRLTPPPPYFHPLVMLATAGVITYFSLRKSLELSRGGGMAVAQMMGARQVIPARASPLEQRLVNVVQEMAIAAGTRVPIVYVMDDYGGINAFAAGSDGSLCVIVVTRGALQRLNRTELQAVIGHEFSHIVNGDMALNLRMIGLLSGLLVIGSAGEHMIRAALAEEGEGAGNLLALWIGVIIFVAGYSALFFGRLIKAGVAREREFLADAGSVQFTRNPAGMAGALDQVRRSFSTILHLNVEQVSHLFFAEAVYLDEERLLGTHPPIAERIDRLVPHFRETEYRQWRLDPVGELEKELAGVPSVSQAVESGTRVVAPPAVVAMVGTIDERHVNAANALLKGLPPAATKALQSREGAGALALALVLSSRDEVLAREIAAARAAGFEPLAAAAQEFVAFTRGLAPAWRLPLADLAIAELRRQPEDFRRDFVRALDAVRSADDTVSVYRYASLMFMRSQLVASTATTGGQALQGMRGDVITVLSLVAYVSCADKANFRPAFDAGLRDMELGAAEPAARERCDGRALSGALERLRGLAPLAKARLVRGLFAAVCADGSVRVVEATLMRMIGAVLDCPLPPFFEELDPEKLAA